MTSVQIPTTLLRVHLPNALFELYEAQAKEEGTEVESLIERRLSQCINHDSERPLYFDDEQRRQLESILHRNLHDANEVLLEVRKMLEVVVGDPSKVLSMDAFVALSSITLSPALLKRLHSRNTDKFKPFEVFLKEITVQLLEQYVGLR